jgi:hypothetical protein
MYDLLNKHSLHFPSRNDQSSTLRQFIGSLTTGFDKKNQLPTIVNITALNNYGRSIKRLVNKNSSMLLLHIDQLDSILAEYYRCTDARQHTHRYWPAMNQGKTTGKSSNRFLSMRKLSQSLVSLTSVNITGATVDNDDHFTAANNNDHRDDNYDHAHADEDDHVDHLMNKTSDIVYNQRCLVKTLNEKRSSSTRLCRVPVQYCGLFELLDENDRSVEPYHKLSDLIIVDYDDICPQKRAERWPHAFLLRSSCTVYTSKSVLDLLTTTTTTALTENTTRDKISAVSHDSCYESSSDVDTQKNPIILNDRWETIPSGEVLTVLHDCHAIRTSTTDKEQHLPSLLHSNVSRGSPASAPSLIKGKTILSFFKKHGQCPSVPTHSNMSNVYSVTADKKEPFLKCRTQLGDIVYVSFNESGLFSPLHTRINRPKLTHEFQPVDMSGVFPLPDLLRNFRFPISVRLADTSIAFDNIYSPATTNRADLTPATSTKFRFLMPYHEHVVFACPLQLLSSKVHKSNGTITIIPISIYADIQVQPCLNMTEISRTNTFIQLVQTCTKIIEQYRTDISLIHFPLQSTNNSIRDKSILCKKRSQSESYVEFLHGNTQTRFKHSVQGLNMIESHVNVLPSSSSHYCDSTETIRQEQMRTNNDRCRSATISSIVCIDPFPMRKYQQYKQSQFDAEDEIYKDLDKIYDYVRSGDITDDVQQIQAKELANHLMDTSEKTIGHVRYIEIIFCFTSCQCIFIIRQMKCSLGVQVIIQEK